MRVKLQLVISHDDGHEETVTDIITLTKNNQRIEHLGYALKAGQLTYDCRYSTMHGMPVTGGCGFRGLKPLWYNGVPP